MNLFKIIAFWVLVIIPIFAQSFGSTKGNKLSAEKWFDWNGSDWVIRLCDDYILDSLGNVSQLAKYYYNSSGVLTEANYYNRTNYADYYTLRYSYSWTGYKQGGTYNYIYKYNLSGLKTGYTYSYDYWSIMGGSNEDNIFIYTYTDGQLSNISETYSLIEYKSGENDKAEKSNDYTYSTDYTYDAESRVMAENKKSLVGSNWIDLERTIWTYNGNSGTGINEIYKNTVWIFKNKKTRTLNASYDPSFENRNVWSWGYWINSQTDNLYYGLYGHLYDTQTKIYNTNTATYDNYKRYSLYYQYFGPPEVPENLTTEITETQIIISWDQVDGAVRYTVYSSAEPYGTFTEDTTGILTGTRWTAPVSESKKFFRVTAIDGGK